MGKRLSFAFVAFVILAACTADVASGAGTSALEEGFSTIHFGGDWSEWVEGPLHAGRTIEIAYDVDRLPCRGDRYGRPAWSIQIHHRTNGGPVSTQTILGHEAYPGANVRTIELEAEGALEVWFESSSVWGCHEWDSSFGANYVFEVTEDPSAPGWMGNAVGVVARGTCEGGACESDRRPLEDGFRYDTWARQRALVRVLSFDVWKAGVTDHDNPDLWLELDVQMHYSFGPEGEWQSRYADFARRVGNDARYEVRIDRIDPQGGSTRTAETCPDVPLTLDPSGQYVQTPIELYFTVNGHALRADDGSDYAGVFEDYAGLYAACDVR
jgi:hypothetical protein